VAGFAPDFRFRRRKQKKPTYKEGFLMKNLVHLTTAIALTRESLQHSVWRRYFLFIPFIAALASFAFSLTARAVDPPPDGDYGNETPPRVVTPSSR
jgi:hypothetical protein